MDYGPRFHRPIHIQKHVIIVISPANDIITMPKERMTFAYFPIELTPDSP